MQAVQTEVRTVVLRPVKHREALQAVKRVSLVAAVSHLLMVKAAVDFSEADNGSNTNSKRSR